MWCFQHIPQFQHKGARWDISTLLQPQHCLPTDQGSAEEVQDQRGRGEGERGKVLLFFLFFFKLLISCSPLSDMTAFCFWPCACMVYLFFIAFSIFLLMLTGMGVFACLFCCCLFHLIADVDKDGCFCVFIYYYFYSLFHLDVDRDGCFCVFIIFFIFIFF